MTVLRDARQGRIVAVAALLLPLALLAAGCQTTAPDGAVSYTLFYDQGDHLRALSKEEKYEEAAEVYAEHKSFFESSEDKYAPDLQQLSEHLNQPRKSALEAAYDSIAAMTWPVPEAEWEHIRKARAEAEAELKAYDQYDILTEAAYRLPIASRLTSRLAEITHEFEGSAPVVFAAYDHFGERSFFDLYPLELDAPAFMTGEFAGIRDGLASASTENLAQFLRLYPKDDVLEEETYKQVSNLYIPAYLRETAKPGDADLRTILGAIKSAEDRGFTPSEVPGTKVGFIEVTSKTLLKHGQIEFPAEIEIDMPFDAVKADLDEALSVPLAESVDYLIVFDVVLAKTSRRVTAVDKISSTFLAGYHQEPNPAYEVARLKVAEAQSDLTSMQLQNAGSSSGPYYSGGAALLGALGELLGGFAVIAARSELREAFEELNNTPRTVKVPDYADYKFDKARVKASKVMTVNYYVIDRRGNAYFKSTFDVIEKRDFSVVYKLHDKDRNRLKHLADAHTEKDVADWEEAPVSVKLSQLVDHYLANETISKELPDLAALREEMLRDKNIALAKAQTETFDARPLNDPRFDSVVVIYNPEGSLGSGFFIRSDVVLTNWHVIEGVQYVEMKMYDGQETFGKVIASDARLDLALIKVQTRGKPVKFYMENTIDLGHALEIIGHPLGLEYSITRGVVSAVRYYTSVNLPGAKEFLMIQTDAATSPGNSGGPWFLGDEVVAITSWGRVDEGSENLNFGVHYSEVLKFLKEALPTS